MFKSPRIAVVCSTESPESRAIFSGVRADLSDSASTTRTAKGWMSSSDGSAGCLLEEGFLGFVAPVPSGLTTSWATSSADVTHTAGVSLRSRWQPAELALVTGPGTAPTGRSRVKAWWAVLREPDRQPASMTAVAWPRAAMSRLRCKKRQRVGAQPHGSSLTTMPTSMMRLSSVSCPLGYNRSTPPAKTATVVPSLAKAARCAMPSMP